MASQYTVDPTDFAHYWGQAMAPLYEAAVAFVFYVIFLVMFALAMRLLHHNKVSGGRYLVIVTSAMFFFATIQLILRGVLAAISLSIVKLEVEGSSLRKASLIRTRVIFTQYFALVTNNAVTDSFFIYRCYVVWGRTICITILPIIMLAGATILGYVATVQNDYLSESKHVTAATAFILSAATNAFVTILTAGRIWWVRREERANLLQPNRARIYNTAVAMLLESGIIYSFFVIGYVVTEGVTVFQNVIVGAMFLIDIVPILMIVRVGLNHDRRESETSEPVLTDPEFLSIGMRSFSRSILVPP
ncbi:hypothetical protein B0H11DRAFT_1215433 [Mycena galericulata]|nr:hypothetical protein B0H11DRAFT_1215433 [Mycena galericulata]